MYEIWISVCAWKPDSSRDVALSDLIVYLALIHNQERQISLFFKF